MWTNLLQTTDLKNKTRHFLCHQGCDSTRNRPYYLKYNISNLKWLRMQQHKASFHYGTFK